MSRDGSFVCVCVIEAKEGSKEVEKKLLASLGARCTSWVEPGGITKYVWRVKRHSVAIVMAEAARMIPGVQAEAREPLDGE